MATAPISAAPAVPVTAGSAPSPDRDDPRFESGADADGPGSAGGWLRALVFLALGVGLLWGGFLAIKPKPGAGVRPRTAPPPVSTPAGLVAAAVPDATLMPALAPAAARPSAQTAPAATPADPAPAAGAASPPPAVAAIARGTLIGPPIDLRLTRGETAHLALTADAPGELHLHGYDLARTTQPGVPAELRFTAGQTGRFPLEWHGPRHSHVEVGVVEVYP